MALKRKWYQRLALRLGPLLYRLLSRALFGSCRVEEMGTERLPTTNDDTFIATFWHYSVAFCLHRARGMDMVAMVSASGDGEYVARLLHGMGIETVRGSRAKGGLAALKSMQKAMDRGRNAVIVADGSQGPPLVVQAGAILLASRTGKAILPMAWAADRYITFNSWDRTILPKPFARLAVCYGKPFTVPAPLKKGDMEIYRQRLEKRLLEVYRTAWGHFGKEGH